MGKAKPPAAKKGGESKSQQIINKVLGKVEPKKTFKKQTLRDNGQQGNAVVLNTNLEIKQPKDIPKIGEQTKKRKNKENEPKVPVKKPNLLDEDQNGAESKLNTANINKAIFGLFNKLETETNTKLYITKIISLLSKEKNSAKTTATCAYALKRLIRCTGADNMETVIHNSGYFHAIVGEVVGLDPVKLLDLLKHELHVSGQKKGKEDTLAAVGQLITAYAIVQSHHFKPPNEALIGAVYPILTAFLKGRGYLVGMSAEIMIKSFIQVDAENFETIVWPMLKLQLCKPVTAMNLHYCDLLLSVHLRFPKVLPLKQLESVLWPNCKLPLPPYEQLFVVYLGAGRINDSAVFERLGKFLAAPACDQWLNAWQQHAIDQVPKKIKIDAKCYIIQTLAHVLLNYKDVQCTNNMPLAKLLGSEPFLGMVIQEMFVNKRIRPTEKRSLLELKHACRLFEKVLICSFHNQAQQAAIKLSLLRQVLQLQPKLDTVLQTRDFLEQMYNQLDEQGLKTIYDFYKGQLVSNDKRTSRASREYYLKQMQLLLSNPRLPKDNSHIDFLLRNSIFYLNEQEQPCSSSDAAAYNSATASRCEEMMFSYLTNNVKGDDAQLATFVERLRSIMRPLAEQLAKPEINATMRLKPTPEVLLSWEKVKQVLETPTGEGLNDEARSISLVFEILILFLGLAMHAPVSKMSPILLEDLFICKQNALNPKQDNEKKSDDVNWQDVLTDVLLQLLVQTGHSWREFVNAIFGALMPHLAKNNLEQVLNMLDLKSNPLGVPNVEQDSDDDYDYESDVDEDENDDVDAELKVVVDVETISDIEMSDSDVENSDDNDVNTDDKDATNLEQIRENVRRALLNEEDKDDDGSSIDWNDVDEAAGERLNQSLAQAFKSFKFSGGRKRKRATKSERVKSTTLLHFRTRVLDLVELFVTAKPTMDVILNGIVSVFNVIRNSSSNYRLQSLAEASKKLLGKLLNLKIHYNVPAESKEPIVDCLKEFLSMDQQNPTKKAGQLGQTDRISGEPSKWRNKCIVYLVTQFDDKFVSNSPVWPPIKSYLDAWATNRRMTLGMETFDALVGSSWSGTEGFLILFVHLLEKPFLKFRRVPIMDMFFKNWRHISPLLAKNDLFVKQLNQVLSIKEQENKLSRKETQIRTKLIKKLQQFKVKTN